MTREEALAETTRQLENARNTLKISKNKAVLTATANKIDYLVAVQAALRPASREQVEKVWRGEWKPIERLWKYSHQWQCSRCGHPTLIDKKQFCDVCGAPMTGEAVEMVMERLEALKDV